MSGLIVILLGLMAVAVVLFYSMQKYAVISKDGVLYNILGQKL